MPKLKSFSNTKISLTKSQEDIEDLLDRVGVTGSRWSHIKENQQQKTPGRIICEFAHEEYVYRISVDYQTELGPRGGNTGTTREQAGRALYWHLKNMFDSVEYGIVTIQQAFLPYMITDRGSTMAEMVERQPILLKQLSSGSSTLFALPEYSSEVING